MKKIKIRLPATLTDFGPSLGGLGLALGLYTHVEFSLRDDALLVVDTAGEGAGHYAIGLRHPVALAMMRVFQKLERAPLGIQVNVDNQIPLASGLGAEAAMMAAGIVGANNLMGNPFDRSTLIQLAAQAADVPVNAITAILGGLTVSIQQGDEDKFLFHNLPIETFKLIVAVPQLRRYSRTRLPRQVASDAMLATVTRIPLFLEALKRGDMAQLGYTLQNDIIDRQVTQQITGYAHVAEVAQQVGANAITTTGGGPAMVFFAADNHKRIASVIENAYRNLDVEAHVFVLPIDTQGIVISMMG